MECAETEAFQAGKLREKLGGCSPELFTPLPDIPAHHIRRRRILERIMQLEIQVIDKRRAKAAKVRVPKV